MDKRKFALQKVVTNLKNKRIDKRSLALSKSMAHVLYKSVKNHTKRPEIHEQKSDRSSPYYKMSISEWEQKYGI